MLSAQASGYLYNALSLNKGPESMIFIFISSDACIRKEAESKSVKFFFQVQDIGILSHG